MIQSGLLLQITVIIVIENVKLIRLLRVYLLLTHTIPWTCTELGRSANTNLEVFKIVFIKVDV